jgi:hypothetical protein
MSKKIALLILAFLVQSLCISGAMATNGDFDKVAFVTRVIDGDTFDIDDGDRVRLADLNTPENGEAGFQEANDYVTGLVEGKTVYLDIDDKYTFDTTGTRVVAVVFVSYNSTHYLNLNKALLENHYAVVWEHDNEFNPNEWSLFVSKAVIPEFSVMMLLVFIVIPVSIFLLGVKTHEKRHTN